MLDSDTMKKNIMYFISMLLVAVIVMLVTIIAMPSTPSPAAAAEDCQQYADAAVKELTIKWYGVSVQQAHGVKAIAWAMLYQGCRSAR